MPNLWYFDPLLEGGPTAGTRLFKVILIKPSHYDSDGYVIQWHRSTITLEFPG